MSLCVCVYCSYLLIVKLTISSFVHFSSLCHSQKWYLFKGHVALKYLKCHEGKITRQVTLVKDTKAKKMGSAM